MGNKMSNYEVTQGLNGQGIVKSWTKGVNFESQARDQLKNIASLPFIHSHVAAMPDVHLGIGATVGSVIATKGAIIPAAVGVDIGCGMNAIRLSLKAEDLPDSLVSTRHEIEKLVPVGHEDHNLSRLGSKHNSGTTKILNNYFAQLEPGYKALVEKHPAIAKMGRELDQRVYRQIGTLGGGNHFIELCLDEVGDVWVMLHSGSRNPGNCIGRYFIDLAKQDMERHFISLPDKDLAYLVEGTDHYDDYVEGVSWAQDFAYRNRQAMMTLVLTALQNKLPPFTITKEAINCHHNYVAMENHFGANVHVTRKGAVRARVGDYGIIPGSMGAKSFIVRGLGNADSFHSCSHGAGRNHSRSAAKKLFSVEDHEKATAGVECRKDAGVIDETPLAYKDIDAVMEAQKDLVEIVHTLKQVVCVKG
jgi:tRNA-splicing ligase RtcB